MLNTFRKISKGPAGWVLATIIFIPFAFFGIESYFVNSSETKVISVGDESITNVQFNSLWQNEQRRIQNQNLPDEVINLYRINLVQSLIVRLIVQNYVNLENFSVSDKKVGFSVASNPIFSENNQFSKDKYFNLLQQNQIVVSEYENSIRDDLKANQLNSFLNNATFLTNKEKSDLAILVSQKRSGGYQIFNPSEDLKDIDITDSEILQYFENNKTSFSWPSKTKLSYILIDKNNLQNVDITAEEIKQYYENFESRELREIYISKENNTDSKKDKKEVADKIVQAINQKKQNFQSLLTFSDDSENFKNQGRLGFVEKGVLTEDFEKVAFSLNESEAGMVETQLGYHIIWVEKIMNYKKYDFSQFENVIKTKLEQDKINDQYSTLLRDAKSINYDNPSSLDQLSDTLNIKVETTDFIEQNFKNIPEIFDTPKVRNVAFTKELIDGSNSEVIEISNEKSLVFRLTDYTEETQKSLEEAKNDIIQALKLEKAIAQLKSDLDEKILTINDGEAPLSEVFTNWKELKSIDENSANEQDANIEVLATLFSLSLPQKQNMNLKTVILSNNQVAVVGLSEVDLKNENEITESEKNMARLILNQTLNRKLIDGVFNQLRESYKVFVSNDLVETN